MADRLRFTAVPAAPGVSLLINESFSGITWSAQPPPADKGAAFKNIMIAAGRPDMWYGHTGALTEVLAVDPTFYAFVTPTGGPTNGFYRHYRVPGFDKNSGGISLTYSVANGGNVREGWWQYKFRYPTGMFPTATVNSPGTGNWNFTKDIYFNLGGVNKGVSIPGFGQGQSYGMACLITGNRIDFSNSTHGWQNMMGGTHGDGQWHTMEWHFKADAGLQAGTSHNGLADGVCEWWLDGVQGPTTSTAGTGSVPNNKINWSAGDPTWTGWASMLIGSNQSDPGTDSTEWWTDFADIKFSTTGYIGL